MHAKTGAESNTSAELIRHPSGPAVAAAILLLPLSCQIVASNAPVGISFLPYFLLILAAINIRRRARIRGNLAYLAGWLLAPIMLLAMVASRSTAGLLLTVSAFGGAVTVLVTSDWEKSQVERFVALPLLIASSFQAFVVILQTVTDRAVVLNWFVPDAALREIDGLLRAQGTMTHVYEPPALGLLAAGVAIATRPRSQRTQLIWVVGVLLAGMSVGLTHSRAAVLGLLLMAPFVAWGAKQRDGHLLRMGSALFVGFALASAFTASAWLHRVDHSTSGSLDDVALGRITLAKQAVEIATDNPILGVGPGRYLTVLETQYDVDENYPYRVHNVSLALAVETGIAAAIVLSIIVGTAVVRASRSGPAGGALAMSILGFALFDVLHYDRPVGILMFGIWLAVLQHHQSTTSRLVKSA